MKANNRKTILSLVAGGVLVAGIATYLILANQNKKGSQQTAPQEIVQQTENTRKTETKTQDTETQNKDVGEYQEKSENGTSVNTSTKLKEEKEYKDLKFTNINLSGGNEETSLTANVTNESNKEIEDFTTIDIRFIDAEGNEINTITGLIKPLKPGETAQLDASVTADLTNAYNFEITEHSN